MCFLFRLQVSCVALPSYPVTRPTTPHPRRRRTQHPVTLMLICRPTGAMASQSLVPTVLITWARGWQSEYVAVAALWMRLGGLARHLLSRHAPCRPSWAAQRGRGGGLPGAATYLIWDLWYVLGEVASQRVHREAVSAGSESSILRPQPSNREEVWFTAERRRNISRSYVGRRPNQQGSDDASSPRRGCGP